MHSNMRDCWLCRTAFPLAHQTARVPKQTPWSHAKDCAWRCKSCCTLTNASYAAGKLGPAEQHKGHDIKTCPPIFDHALERLSIQVVCNVKLLQNLHIECAQVHYMLMHVEGPDVTHVKYFLFAQWRLFELPAVLPTYSRHTCCATTKSAVLMWCLTERVSWAFVDPRGATYRSADWPCF